MILIALNLLGALVVAGSVRSAQATGTLGLTKGYGTGIGSSQPYEPVGAWIDGIIVPQFLVNPTNEWNALKAGDIDLYDWPLRPAQIADFNSNICVPNPTGVTIAPCTTAGQAPIQTQIQLLPVNDFGKFEIDLQNAAFPTNILSFRQAVAYATDKESFITSVLNGLGAPNYSPIGCPALCGPGADGKFNSPLPNPDDLWVDPKLNEIGLTCTSFAGNPLPYGCGNPNRFAIANSLLDAAGFSIGVNGFRVDNAAGCASRLIPSATGLITVSNCGKELQPFFWVRHDDPNREQLGFQIQTALQTQLKIDMDLGGFAKYTGDVQNFFDVNRRVLFTPVFGEFNFNLYTGGWFLGRDPTYVDDLYDSKFIRSFLTNYPNYADPIFDNFARGLRAATSIPGAISLAYAAEGEFNATLPIVDVWTSTAPHAVRIVHKDGDALLNGLKWEGFQNQLGVGPDNGFSWGNMHLVGAPLHNSAHPVFLKWGWKTDLLDRPNPIDSSFVWDFFALGLTHDSLNALATDDALFTGDLPWMASLPVIRVVNPGGAFPNGSICTPDAPAAQCSVLSYQLRTDITFAASLDGKIPALPVTPDDIRFTILMGRDSTTSFLTPGYIHVSDVVVTGPLSFDVYEKNAAIWDRHDIGGTTPVSVRHWCTERGFTVCGPPWNGPPPGGTTGFPDFGVNVLSSTNGPQIPGPPVGVDLGSFGFVYDSQVSFQVGGITSPNGPIVYRLRQTPGLALPNPPYTNPTAPNDGYFPTEKSEAYGSLGASSGQFSNTCPSTTSCTASEPGLSVAVGITGTTGSVGVTYTTPNSGFSLSGTATFDATGLTVGVKVRIPLSGPVVEVTVTGTSTSLTVSPGFVIGGWHKFHMAGNVNWYCTTCSAGVISDMGPLPAPDMVINIVDLAIVAIHFGETPGLVGLPYGHAAWDLSGAAGTPDGTVNIFDLTRVALHFGQSFLGGTDGGGGAVGTLPSWIGENIPGT